MADPIRPLIEVYWCGDLFRPQMLEHLAEGMEEEGVPYQFSRQEIGLNAAVLSSRAAHESHLEVGIGLDAQGNIAVHSRRLPESEPLFQTTWPHEPAELRRMGSHAARLVKGLPFRLKDEEVQA